MSSGDKWGWCHITFPHVIMGESSCMALDDRRLDGGGMRMWFWSVWTSSLPREMMMIWIWFHSHSLYSFQNPRCPRWWLSDETHPPPPPRPPPLYQWTSASVSSSRHGLRPRSLLYVLPSVPIEPPACSSFKATTRAARQLHLGCQCHPRLAFGWWKHHGAEWGGRVRSPAILFSGENWTPLWLVNCMFLLYCVCCVSCVCLFVCLLGLFIMFCVCLFVCLCANRAPLRKHRKLTPPSSDNHTDKGSKKHIQM